MGSNFKRLEMCQNHYIISSLGGKLNHTVPINVNLCSLTEFSTLVSGVKEMKDFTLEKDEYFRKSLLKRSPNHLLPVVCLCQLKFLLWDVHEDFKAWKSNWALGHSQEKGERFISLFLCLMLSGDQGTMVNSTWQKPHIMNVGKGLPRAAKCSSSPVCTVTRVSVLSGNPSPPLLHWEKHL